MVGLKVVVGDVGCKIVPSLIPIMTYKMMNNFCPESLWDTYRTRTQAIEQEIARTFSFGEITLSTRGKAFTIQV